MPVRLYFDEPLTVPWLTGGTFSVILDPEDTVASLKSKIQLQTNIPITNQVLKLDGKELSDQPPPVNGNSKDEPWQSKEARHCSATGNMSTVARSRRNDLGSCSHSQHYGSDRVGTYAKGNLHALLCHKQISPKRVKGMLSYIPLPESVAKQMKRPRRAVEKRAKFTVRYNSPLVHRVGVVRGGQSKAWQQHLHQQERKINHLGLKIPLRQSAHPLI